MNNPGAVAVLLEQCRRALDSLLAAKAATSEEDEREYRRCQAQLPEDLRTLLEEAKEMKWPFVPEKWQYKQHPSPEDKTNLQDMISTRLPDLLVYLKASILVRDCRTAAGIVFLVDRFLYWIDASSQLLGVAKALHRLQPATPLSPQVLLRQARLSANSGKLLKAEYILSSLINDNGATGSWQYAEESDRVLVQSVCLQIRGQILQKLGMWYEAAELIWASVVGYLTLPKPDRKGIATSLGIMADVFASMSDKDYVRFQTSADIDLGLLREFGHRLLSAAEACKLAAAYSQYTPLFVLTAVNIRGVCLLSYSHSKDCPPEMRKFYLSEAKESFEIGLLTKGDESPITSKQELHSFIKAAFCLTTVHRWLYGQSERLQEVRQLCREALGKLYSYSSSCTEEQEKGLLAKEIMSLISSVKKQLGVEGFPNSDARSYVPDSYKGMVEKPILQGEADFEKILTLHSQHHLSVCQVFEKTCRNHKTPPGETQGGACITTLRTETKSIDTVSAAEEAGNRRRGVVATPVSPVAAGSSSERLSGQKNRDLGSDPVRISFDEGTEPWEREINGEKSVSSRWQSRSQTTTSESSWYKLSQSSYSSSWEELEPKSNKESPGEGQQQGQGSAEEQCCTTESYENCQALDLCPSPSRAKHPSPGEPLQSCWGSNQPFLEVEEASHCGEGRHPGNSSSEKQAGEVKNTGPFLSNPSSAAARLQEVKKSSSGCSTKDSVGKGSGSTTSRSQSPFEWVHGDGAAADGTEDAALETRPLTNGAGDSSVQGWLRKSALLGSRALPVPEVDAQAEIVDGTASEFASTGHVANNSAPKPSAPTAVPPRGKTPINQHFHCATTEEDEKSWGMLSIQRQSSSSLSSQCKSAQISKSSPEGSLLSPRAGGELGRTREEALGARLLRDDDLLQLLAGVEHSWLVQRLAPTGIFQSNQLCKAYSALLLKYSKKSGLWTGQETAVFIGDYLNVAKEGKQRRAFWIHFLHQEETLGRYVGKEYKDEKGLLHHLSDVERQMTAQYYVTEFNKRLYEQKVPTQIFYIPSAVLLLLEDRTITGCVSVEPYILGDFVKLSNNTKVVKNEYKATEYGLAYGHFSYQFSNGADVVVDLQGWVTGNGKGLIYLTDPQIHSLNSSDVSRSNFGKKGISYFFNNQHAVCNDICHCLSLTRPPTELLL